MRSPWQTIPALLLLPASISASTLDCNHLRIDKQSFNLKKLGGAKAVHDVVVKGPSIENNTYTIDICRPLRKDTSLDSDSRCPDGTRVCVQKWIYRKNIDPLVEYATPIAGVFPWSHGGQMETKLTRIKHSAGNSGDEEGVIVELHGGKSDNGTKQKAIIKFLCDKSVSGNEGFGDDAEMVDMDQYTSMQRRKEDDDDTSHLPDLDKGKNLKFQSYKMEGDNQVLRLEWKTKYACEGMANHKDPDDDTDKSGGWGFFTWFIIILFLLAAAYIIFGSWLNYNRYGARGWDLIPHGDTIRDIPYIVKDWGSNVTDRLKGGDSRGGYSAV